MAAIMRTVATASTACRCTRCDVPSQLSQATVARADWTSHTYISIHTYVLFLCILYINSGVTNRS